jgi:hypothetical protein
MIDPGCNDLVFVVGIRWSSRDGRRGFGWGLSSGRGDGSYSDPARDANGVGNMPIDSDSGALRDNLSDGSPSTETKDGVEP